MADVFISYKQEERERMRPIANALIDLGLEVWFDARLEAGTSFSEEIQREIDTCRAQIVCWSPAAVSSEWVRGEAEIGRKRGVLVPVLIEPCRLPPPFNMIHAENLIGWDGRSEHEAWRGVLRALSRHVGRELAGPAPWTPKSEASASRPSASIQKRGLPELVLIPPGRFLMGSPANELGRDTSESPQHEVRIDYAFELGKHPVTFSEWDAARVAGANLHRPVILRAGRDRHPVVMVSWDDAQAYLKFLNLSYGGGYRLPSEAEWEYACRAGTTTRFNFSDDETHVNAYAWYLGNAGQRTHPVGEKRPNAFGLHDMHGNVREWCEDAWHANYDAAPVDGSAWVTGDISYRVLRGGSWGNYPQNVRSANRFRADAGVRDSDIGFRIARAL